MELRWRPALGLLVAVLLLAVPLLATAQDDNTVRIDGSRIVSTLIEPLAEAYAEQAEIDLSLEISGTSSGIEQLCAGETDIATAARAITTEEEENCTANNTEWVEVIVGQNAAVLAVNPAAAFTECVTLSEVSTLLSLGATDTITTWDAVNAAWDPAEFTLYAPPAGAPAYTAFDAILPGEGLRTDGNIVEDSATMVDSLIEDVSGVGFLPWSTVSNLEAQELTLLSVDDQTELGCTAASQESIEDGTYAVTSGLYLYVNAASLEREAVGDLLSYIVAEENQATIIEAGYTPNSADRNAEVLANIAGGVTGRQFSEGDPLYTIPMDISGSVTVESSAGPARTIGRITSEFTGFYSNVTIDVEAFGNPAAYRKLCNGEVDLAAVTRTPTSDESAACEENNISLWEVPLGHQAVVMLANGAADFAACLTTDQLATFWQDQGEDTITNWSQLGEGFPDLEVTLFLPTAGSAQTDFILAQVSDELLLPRQDALEERNNEGYRAAATGNVEGAVTYMRWPEYLAEEEAQDLQVIAVDAGDGCVEPSLETIQDGSYLLAQEFSLQISEQALARPEVQAVVWHFFSRTSLAEMENQNVIPLSEETYQDYEIVAVERFAEAEAAAAAAEEAAAEEEVGPSPAETGTDEAGADETGANETGTDAGANADDSTPQQDNSETEGESSQ